MKLLACVTVIAVAASLHLVAEEGKTFGKGVGKAPEVKIADLVAHPDQYVGKTVRVEGVVVDVCTKAGCWMDLATDGGSDKIRIKVDDGVMVFPTEAKGSQASAEGVFTKIEMKPAEARAHAKHMAEDAGLTPDAAKQVEAPTVIYQIKGTGAVIR
jgi:hypothetical protein